MPLKDKFAIFFFLLLMTLANTALALHRNFTQATEDDEDDF